MCCMAKFHIRHISTQHKVQQHDFTTVVSSNEDFYCIERYCKARLVVGRVNTIYVFSSIAGKKGLIQGLFYDSQAAIGNNKFMFKDKTTNITHNIQLINLFSHAYILFCFH